MEKLEKQTVKMIKKKPRQKWVLKEMQKTILMESESILRKVMSRVV